MVDLVEGLTLGMEATLVEAMEIMGARIPLFMGKKERGKDTQPAILENRQEGEMLEVVGDHEALEVVEFQITLKALVEIILEEVVMVVVPEVDGQVNPEGIVSLTVVTELS